MKNRNNCILNFSRLLVIACLILCFSCKEEAWDDHYEQLDSRLENNIISILSEDPEYTTFVQLLEQTGYKSQLETSQAFTVWAPSNAALEQVSDNILNDPDLLKNLIGNHISLFSYNTTSNEQTFVKMFNNKYVEFINTNDDSSFGDVDLVEKDILASNGIIHTIDDVLEVNQNIWEYLNNNSAQFPSLMTFLSQFNEIVFDEENSIKTGTNSLGQTVYDSIFKLSNTYFKVIGDLNSEEKRYSFIGLTEPAYTGIYDVFKDYYQHPIADTIQVNTDRTIFSNLNFLAVDLNDLDGTPISTTTGNEVILDNTIAEDVALSNGNIFVVNTLDYNPKDVIYKPVKYEIEDSERRTIGNLSDLTIQKKFNITASGRFINDVNLAVNPDASESNNYFEIAFSNVLSASYTLHLKFAPIGASQQTKLKFELSYVDENNDIIVNQIPPIIVNNLEENLIQIGDTYTFPVYINQENDNNYYVKLKVFVDVSESELILYDRRFGIDYAELIPIE
ncbi:fasciclin domain-containing protein [Flavivirga aquimarina]|uniref:Fasciclin domain-containing protein n=1 Tax=Flavivirga aquimarina TaxID=2027862 RepID=A0ABT8WDU7_9FLAO|nr:fasciclin domain-containing protein [Flavivirga aquimarina]MDO5971335.1 fasciclin domain-containing protein [Flavivirga aquimarina]